MYKTKGYAVQNAESKFEPFEFERRELNARDVLIEIMYCGVCHTDIHQVRNEWQTSIYPMVPGHEIVGRVVQTGTAVTKFKKGAALISVSPLLLLRGCRVKFGAVT